MMSQKSICEEAGEDDAVILISWSLVLKAIFSVPETYTFVLTQSLQGKLNSNHQLEYQEKMSG